MTGAAIAVDSAFKASGATGNVRIGKIKGHYVEVPPPGNLSHQSSYAWSVNVEWESHEADINGQITLDPAATTDLHSAIVSAIAAAAGKLVDDEGWR